MTKLLKDPLVHFLAIGAALFAFAAWRGQSIGTGKERISISAAQIEQARDAAALLQGRPLTDDELAALIEPTVRDEVLYREALALGLDENDDEVRRRLIEKMQYLSQDTADPEPSSEAELRAFYDASRDTFEVPELATFDQVYFSPSARGDALRGAVDEGLAALRAGRPPAEVGDRTPLRETYENAPREQVEVLFGDALAEAVFTLASGAWTGPFESDFGQHLVRLRSRSEKRLPPFDEIREQVVAEFAAQRRRERNEAEYRRMRERYEIVIDWPESAPVAAGGGSAP
jgi:peptidyl-prolyl cis-trans isomerase C